MKTREELAQIWVAERIRKITEETNFPGKDRVLSEYTMTQVIVGKELIEKAAEKEKSEKCLVCDVMECSTKNDPTECLKESS